MAMKLKIKKNDTVRVIAGNDKGKEGRVIRVLPDKMRVVVEGVNIRKRHMRPTQARPEGAIVEREMPIHYSNVMILDGAGNTTRINSKIVEEDGARKRVRIANTTGDML
jgi:large subunit ribosomal protein L24